MNFLGDLFNSLKTTLSERTKSYYIGSFIFSWITFNWTIPLILLFSSKDIEGKINYVSNTININSALWYPAAMSLVLSILLPCINMVVSWLQKWPNKLVRGITASQRQEQYKEDIVTEALRAEKDMAYQKKTVSESLEVQNLQAQIQESKNISEKLQDEIEKLKGELDVKNHETAELNEKIDEVEASVMFKDSNIESLTNNLNSTNNSLAESNKQLASALKENQKNEDRISKWKDELDKFREDRKLLHKELPILFSLSSETKTFELNARAITAVHVATEYLKNNRAVDIANKVTPSQLKLLQDVFWSWPKFKENIPKSSGNASSSLRLGEQHIAQNIGDNLLDIKNDK
ncbi:hypothetical protein SM94_05260 [Klebsiella pneumoniae]|nr:hypothetical protein SM94_05260 [Klebsiella pneumoniae]SSI77151.1 Membrane-bound metallopeptidase [Klebsiella pneumoniae]